MFPEVFAAMVPKYTYLGVLHSLNYVTPFRKLHNNKLEATFYEVKCAQGHKLGSILLIENAAT